ncbi:methylmalonyl-CoA mutase family protein [Fredinandcohnia sp. QZ13]|uniref:methylmalonyl-CoA mutase family protein n=1 Tax=Fredinandcohnia sp. QZ13 TaxID=3073144 RepID=UPI0028532D6C|nr:methylmalonyl-CoA mutase family protein [Fredinandcohnia sp. QZ13]MDR4888854.1 methylmalonyl-CoA mutase family protein [Fredinandcohnia sp. QZ13]
MTKQSKEFQNITFPTIDYETWKQEAEKSLKGKPIEKLHKQTYEKITLKPIYTKKDVQKIPFLNDMPGEGSRVRGSKPTGYLNQPWHVSQEMDLKTPEEFNPVIREALQNGQTMIHFTLQPKNGSHKGLALHTEKDIEKAFNGISLTNTPLLIDAQTDLLVFLSLLQSHVKTDSLTGTIGMDPLGILVETGQLSMKPKAAYDQLAESVEWVMDNQPNLRTILVKGEPYHNGGANAVQELAFTMGTAIEYMSELLERGLTVDQIAPRMTFSFSIGSNVFMEIAKLRASKILWKTIIEAYGGNEDSCKLYIHARTSAFTKTIYDPYVNMLRSTIEAFSAIVGGIDSLHVSAFDEPIKTPNTFSRRIARNTQSILREESFLNKVIDPAGGSWYVETLTNELAEKAWELLNEIESEGGMLEALKAGTVQERISLVLQERQKNVNNRKEKIVGTNMYANIQEKPIAYTKTKSIYESNEAVISINRISPVRISESFEQLRQASEQYLETSGERPKVGLINLGSIPEHKPRADFITGFFEAGGFQVIKNDGYLTARDAIEGAKTMNLTTYIICGKDDSYKEMATDICNDFKKSNPDVRLFIAGKLENEEFYRNVGINDFIHIGTNCFAFLHQLQQEMGVR